MNVCDRSVCLIVEMANTNLRQLLLEQKGDVDELNRVIRNYSSDGQRKNERYLADKYRLFVDLFRMIREKNDTIMK